MAKKGSRRRMFAAIARRKRNPEEWFRAPVSAVKVAKNKVLALVPTKKNRDG